MKKMIQNILFCFFISLLPLSAVQEGDIRISGPSSGLSSQISGAASDGTNYLIFTLGQIARADTNLSLNASTGVNSSPYHSWAAYDGTNFILYNEDSNVIEKVSGSEPTNLTVIGSFTPPGTTTVKGLASDRQGHLFLVASDSNFYVIDEDAAFAAHNTDKAVMNQKTFPFSLDSIKGIAYDGMFLWYMDSAKWLKKLDSDSLLPVAEYSNFGTLTDLGDLAYDGRNMVISGSDDGGNSYQLFTIAVNPKPITNITIVDDYSGNSMTVNFVPSSDSDIFDYHIYYGPVSGSATNEIMTGGKAFYQIMGLKKSVSYKFYVIPENAENLYITNVSSLLPAEKYSRTGTPTYKTMIRYVSKSGKNIPPFTTAENASTNLQNALDAANVYDTIQITDNHIYKESLFIDKEGLCITGTSENSPTIISYPTGDAVIKVDITNGMVLLKNLIISNKGDTSSSALDFSPLLPASLIISNCRIRGTGDQTGIMIGANTTLKVFNSRLEHFWRGLNAYNFHTLLVKHTLCEDNETALLVDGVCSNIEISYSMFYNIQNQGLVFSNLQTSDTVKIIKNYFFNNLQSIVLNNIKQADFSIFNNTFYLINTYVLYLDTSSLISSSFIDMINNIFANIPVEIGYLKNISGKPLNFKNYNNCFVDRQASFYFAEGVVASEAANLKGVNPLMKDPDSQNFNLRPNSPCIDRGRDVGLPFYGKAPDIGAFEIKGLDDIYSDFSEEAIYSKNNVEMDHVNLAAGQTAHILIKNLFYNINLISSDEIHDKSSLRIDIFSVTGEKIATLYNNIIRQNIMQVDFVMDDFQAPSGLYFLKITSNKFSVVKKFTYVR